MVVSVYIPPSEDLVGFGDTLTRIRSVVTAALPGRVVVAVDFNTKSAEWDSPVTDARGEVLGEWAAGLDLRVLNVRSRPTCVRWNGVSIMDITLGTLSIVRPLRPSLK